MRYLLTILVALLPAAPMLHAASPGTLWAASASSSRGGGLAPAAMQPLVADGNGDVVVVAVQGDPIDGCIVTLKYSGGDGAMAWRREACGDRNVSAVGVFTDAAGNVIVAGNGNGGFRLLKYSGASGAPMWDQRPGGGELQVAAGLALDAAGNVFLLGKAAGASTEVWIAKHRGADGSLAWQQPVDGGAETTPVGIVVDRAGNALILGNYVDAGGDPDWHVAKLAGDSGAVLWRKIYDSGEGDVATAIALDGSGDFLVAGTSIASGGNRAIRAVKSAGATGRTVWDRRLGPNAAALGLRADASGNVIVTGFSIPGGSEDLTTLKLASADGSVLWQAVHASAGRDAGRAVAVDPQGNVVVTGATDGSPAGAEFRTLMYAADGSERWSAGIRGAGSQDSGLAVIAHNDAVFAIGQVTEAGKASTLRLMKFSAVASPASAFNVQGLWWKDAAESGWGVNLTQQGELLFATWFTYDAQGQPMWLVMSRGERVGDTAYAGLLYRMQGPAFDAVPFEFAKVLATPVGTASFSFSDANHGLFRYTVNGVAGVKPITRQVFASLLPTCSFGGPSSGLPNYQDLWWSRAGAEAGWGLNITHQGDTLFVTWFTYGGDGRGIWLVGSNVARTGNATYSGTLYRTVGQPFDAAHWSATNVGIAAAGRVTLTFADPDNGTFTYTLDGITQSKPIARQIFATPKTTCD